MPEIGEAAHFKPVESVPKLNRIQGHTRNEGAFLAHPPAPLKDRQRYVATAEFNPIKNGLVLIGSGPFEDSQSLKTLLPERQRLHDAIGQQHAQLTNTVHALIETVNDRFRREERVTTENLQQGWQLYGDMLHPLNTDILVEDSLEKTGQVDPELISNVRSNIGAKEDESFNIDYVPETGDLIVTAPQREIEFDANTVKTTEPFLKAIIHPEDIHGTSIIEMDLLLDQYLSRDFDQSNVPPDKRKVISTFNKHTGIATTHTIFFVDNPQEQTIMERVAESDLMQSLIRMNEQIGGIGKQYHARINTTNTMPTPGRAFGLEANRSEASIVIQATQSFNPIKDYDAYRQWKNDVYGEPKLDF